MSDEIRDALDILQMLCETPSKLPKRKLSEALQHATAAERLAWRYLSGADGDPEAVLQALKDASYPLLRSAKRQTRGRPSGAIARSRQETDELVLQAIANGAGVRAAVRAQYPHGFDGHLKRIQRRRKHLRLINLPDDGDIK